VADPTDRQKHFLGKCVCTLLSLALEPGHGYPVAQTSGNEESSFKLADQFSKLGRSLLTYLLRKHVAIRLTKATGLRNDIALGDRLLAHGFLSKGKPDYISDFSFLRGD
jgi:hypothetical protein